MAKFIAVTQFGFNLAVRVHMVENYHGSRNHVLQYYRDLNNNNTVTIPATVVMQMVATMADANKIVEDQGLVEMITLRGTNGLGAWQSKIYCEAFK